MIEIKKIPPFLEEEQVEEKVMLSRNILFYYLLLGIFVKAYLTPHPILIKLLFVVGIALIGAEIYIVWIKRKLEIEIRPLPHVLHKGEHIQLQVTVRNLSRLPLPYVYLFLKESYVLVPKEIQGLCFTLGPKSQQTFRINYEALRSGRDQVGIEQIIWMDYLEIVKRHQKYKSVQEIIVLPQMPSLKEKSKHIDALSQSIGGEVEEKSSRSFGGEVSYELIPYEEGTSERLIHWKLVAQRDLYQVREREQFIQKTKQHVVIMDPFWMNTDGEGRKKAYWMDQLITHYMTCLYERMNQGEKVYWLGYGKDGWTSRLIQKHADLYEIEAMLCKYYFRQDLEEADRISESILVPIIKDEAAEKILLTSHLEASLKEILENEIQLKVIWLQIEEELHI